MKLTANGQTLFQELSTRFTDKIGRPKHKAAFGNHATLLADRNDEGEIYNITLRFYDTDILSTGNRQNTVLLNTGGWYSKTTMKHMNNVLHLLGLHLYTRHGNWSINDALGQATEFRDNDIIDLTRPHGSAIYTLE